MWQVASLIKRNYWVDFFMYQYFHDVFKLEDGQNHRCDIYPVAIQYYFWGISSDLILIKDTGDYLLQIKCLALNGTATPERSGWSHGEPKQLSALHFSSYCLVILQKQVQLPTERTSFPPGTSKNCRMNLTLPIPLRGSAFPRNSYCIQRAGTWEKVLFLKDWMVARLSEQPSLGSSETQLAKILAGNDSLIHSKTPRNGCTKKARDRKRRQVATRNDIVSEERNCYPFGDTDNIPRLSCISETGAERQTLRYKLVHYKMAPKAAPTSQIAYSAIHATGSHLVFHHLYFLERFSSCD